jgi:hypothetical protein
MTEDFVPRERHNLCRETASFYFRQQTTITTVCREIRDKLRRCCRTRRRLVRRLFPFFRRIRGSLLEALGVRFQTRRVRRALRLNGGFFIGLGTTRGSEDADDENRKEKSLHIFGAVGMNELQSR